MPFRYYFIFYLNKFYLSALSSLPNKLSLVKEMFLALPFGLGAETGVEPISLAYEASELPLLYSAMSKCLNTYLLLAAARPLLIEDIRSFSSFSFLNCSVASFLKLGIPS